MLNFPLPTRLGEVVDQNRLERQVEQPPPLPLDLRILEDLPAGARPRETAITPLPWTPATDLLPEATPFWPFSHQWIAWQLYTQQWIQSSC
jgi:hypothetical protein